MPRIADLPTPPSAQLSPPSIHQDNAPLAQQLTPHSIDGGEAKHQDSTAKNPSIKPLKAWRFAPFETLQTWINRTFRKPQTPTQAPIEQDIHLSAREIKAGKGKWLSQLTQRLCDAVWCSNLMTSDTRQALQSQELYETVKCLDLIYLNSENTAVKCQIEALFTAEIAGREIKFWGDRAGATSNEPESRVGEHLLPRDKLTAANESLEQWLSEVLRFTGRLNKALKH